MKQTFGKIPRSLIALETGTHSPWVSRLLTELGHEVIVAHAQKVQWITKSNRKDDRHDARTLARLARIDPALLGPVRHRSVQAQLHLTVIRARVELVSVRTALVNAARGLVKSYGERLPKCGTYQVSRELAAALSTELRDVLEPLRFCARWRWAAPEMVEKFQCELEEVLSFFNFPAQWRHRLRTTNLGEGWFKHLRRYLSRFPGCRNAEHSEQILGCFLLAAESMHR